MFKARLHILFIVSISISAFLLAKEKKVELRVKLYEGSSSIFSTKANGFKIDRKKQRVYFGSKSKVFSGSRIKSAAIYVHVKHPLKIKKHKYAGHFLIFLNKTKCLIVQKIDLEKYVEGVLAGEISPSWGMEAIKAQAVAARTFAYYHYRQRKKKLYHIGSGTSHQVFSGLSRNASIYTKAVQATRGEVITQSGKPILAFFSANCGGRTETAEDAWSGGSKVGYLKSTTSPYAKTDPRFYWRVKLNKSSVEYAFKDLLKGRELRSIRVSKKTRSGRASVIQLRAKGRVFEVGANKLRSRLGASQIKSTFFQVRASGAKIFFHGKGYGHGVGLCQWSAKTMAEKGFRYTSILKRFYKGIFLKKVYQLKGESNSKIT